MSKELSDSGNNINNGDLDELTQLEPANEGYKFNNPGKVKIRTRTNDQNAIVDTTGDVWQWEDGGILMSINWSAICLDTYLIEILKEFIAYSLQSKAPRTVLMYAETIKHINKIIDKNNNFLDKELVLHVFSRLDNIDRTYSSSLRTLYKWACDRGIPGFDNKIYLKLKETRGVQKRAYQKVFLQQAYVTIEDEANILRQIRDTYNNKDRDRLQDNIILHMAFEIAPRAIQFHSIDMADFEENKKPGKQDDGFYTLWLPMAKKRGQARPERRPHSISDELGKKIKELIAFNIAKFGSKEPLFLDEKGKRQPSHWFSAVIKTYFENADIDSPTGLTTLFRHHKGQGLADQGAPADVIAESLGHNSTVAARAYIAATPAIAEIKTRALGKSKSYQNLMHMILTGDLITRADIPEERSVRGIVDTQFIGGIGGCGLPMSTPCSYNPIYSCYTCKKFHPFYDGDHHSVKQALQQQAQRFIDVSESTGDLEYNRTPTQLEMTIEAVDAVIARCEDHDMINSEDDDA